MITHCFSVKPGILESTVETGIRRTLKDIAGSTDTSDLVVSIYLTPRCTPTRGSAYVQRWMTPEDFHTARGSWSFTAKLPVPKQLPDRYKLIRLCFDSHVHAYPRSETDRYGWKFMFGSFFDHLALLFAHELHHFRRYHLQMHAGQGEQSANRWALNHVCELGYRVHGTRIKTPLKPGRRRSARRFPLLPDPFARFRPLRAGDPLIIVHDPRSRYTNQCARVLRSIRSNSKRIVIRTQDGQTWRWPMRWLDFPRSEPDSKFMDSVELNPP